MKYDPENLYRVDGCIAFDKHGHSYAIPGRPLIPMPHKEASESVKICRDCKNYRPGPVNACGLFLLKRDIVTGRIDYVPCSAARYDEGKCGESAKRFEKRPTLWGVVVGLFSKNCKEE